MRLRWHARLGGDGLRDLNVLRGDAGLAELRGVGALPAPTTAGEFLRQFTRGDQCALHRLLHLAAQRARPLHKGERVTIELDASWYAQCSGAKQGSRINYKGAVGYYPLFAFWAAQQALWRRPCCGAMPGPRPQRCPSASKQG